MFDVVLKEKMAEDGLTRHDVNFMFDMLPQSAEVYPVEFYNRAGESSAMGFITAEAADKLEFHTDDKSPLGEYIGGILADIKKESYNNEYEFRGCKIYMTR